MILLNQPRNLTISLQTEPKKHITLEWLRLLYNQLKEYKIETAFKPRFLMSGHTKLEPSYKQWIKDMDHPTSMNKTKANN